MNEHKLKQMDTLLKNALSPDNMIRNQAECAIERHLESNRQLCVLGIIGLLKSSPEVPVRALCAIILRRRLPAGEPVLFEKLPEGLQQTVKQGLLASIEHEPERYVRSMVCDTAAALAECLLYKDAWPELVPFLYKCSQAEAGQRLSALEIFGRLVDRCPPETILTPHVEHIHTFYGQCLNAPSDGISSRAVVNVCKAVMNIDENLRDRHMPPFQQFTPRMLAVLGSLLERGMGTQALELLCAMADLATEEPTFFRPQLDEFAMAMLKIGQTEGFEDGVRQLVMECLVLIAEEAPGMVRKSRVFLESAVNLAFTLMLTVEDEPGWTQESESVDLFDNSNFGCGETAFDRLAQAVQGAKLAPVVTPLVARFVSHSDWKFRHTGLYALGQVGEVLHFDMLPMPDIVRFIGDAHPRVRYAALHCLGQLALDFNPQLSMAYHALVIPACIQPLGDAAHPRIQAHATACLFNIVDQCDEELLQPYLDGLLEALMSLFATAPSMVIEGVMNAVAALAGSAPEGFAKWYDRIVPLMKRVMVVGNKTDQSWNLSGKAMDAISFIGLAMGADRFRSDAKEIMGIFLPALATGALAADDVSEQNIMQALPRICEVLGSEFVPFLPALLPALLARADKRENWDALILQVDEDATAATGRWQSRGLTSALEDKLHACSVVACFCHELQGEFYPFVPVLLKIMLPLLGFQLHSDLRSTAIQCMPDIIITVVQAVGAGKAEVGVLKQVFLEIITAMLNCFNTEPDLDMLLVLVGSLQSTVDEVEELAGECLDQNTLEAIGSALLKVLSRSAERISNRALRQTGVDADAESQQLMEAQNATEDQLNILISECVASLMKATREEFVPTFALLLPEIMAMLSADRTVESKKIALFIFDDFVEYAGKAAGLEMVGKLVSAFLAFVVDESSAELRQAAAYGLGLCAMHLPREQFSPFLEQAVARLMAGMGHPAAREDENLSATDNMVSAVGRIAVGHEMPQLLQPWLAGLPLTMDEGSWDHNQLCALVEQNNPHVFGPNNANLPKILAVLAWVVADEAGEDEDGGLKVRAAVLVQQFPQLVPPQVLQQMLAALAPDQQQAVAQLWS